MSEGSKGLVTAVCRSGGHGMTKPLVDTIELRAGLGVLGDAHEGVTVQHRSRVAKDPSQPNLRQLHLIHAELHEELLADGIEVQAGQMGENVTTRGIDLLALPTDTRLHLGATAVARITGLRNPCGQLNGIAPGLLAATRIRLPSGEIVRKAGIMAVVEADGVLKVGDAIEVEMPPAPHRALEPV